MFRHTQDCSAGAKMPDSMPVVRRRVGLTAKHLPNLRSLREGGAAVCL